MISYDSVKKFLSLLFVKSFKLATVRDILEELIFAGGVGDRMVATIVHDFVDLIDSAGRYVCDIADLLHRYTILKKSKYTYSLHNVNTFVLHDYCELLVNQG